MAAPSGTADVRQGLRDSHSAGSSLGEGCCYPLDIGYTVNGDCTAMADPSLESAFNGGSQSLIQLSDSEFEIDIFPDRLSQESLETKNRELEARVEELEGENERLREEVRQMQAKMSKLRSDAANCTSLPTLYNQLSTARKETAAVEKRCQELEAENVELTLKLEKKEPLGSMSDSANQRTSQETLPSAISPLKRSYTFAPLSVLESKPSLTHPTEREAFERTKLDFAEKLVQKDEIIHKLKEQRKESESRLNMLSAGIDGLETRFELQLSTYQAEVAHRFEQMLKTIQGLRRAEEDFGKNMMAVQAETNRILKTFPVEIQKLAVKCRSMEDDRHKERDEMEETLQHTSTNLEEAKKQISALSDENDRRANEIVEHENTIEELEFRIASMKTQRLVSDGMHNGTASTSRELEAMRQHIEKLEASLEDQQMMNETLLRQKDEAEEAYFAVTAVKDAPSVEELAKENKELRIELMEVSQRLVALEEQNDSLKNELESQTDFFSQCLNLEEELEAQRRVNRSLEEHLGRRKKRIESLQNELGNLQQQLGDMEGGFGQRKRMKENKAAVSNHVDGMLQQEIRYEELERILNGVQAERDELLQDKASLNKMMHSLVKENKMATRALNKHKREDPVVKEELATAKAEIMKLQARLKVETLARQHSSKSHLSAELDEDIMSKLVSSQISLAEMDERMIKLRKELHKSVARNLYLTTKITRLEKQLRPAAAAAAT